MKRRAAADLADLLRSEKSSRTPSVRAVRSLAEEVVQRLSRSAGDRRNDAEQDADDVAEVCAALVGADPDRPADLVRRALDAGLDFDTLCETQLAPAARRLGLLWEADEISFAEVTLAASRLFGILRSTAQRPAPARDAPFAVFAAPPGEEHVLGVSMAAERARLAGWEVALLVGLPHETLVARIAESAPDVVGLSFASPRSLGPLTRLVVALRVATPGTAIVVCGPAVDTVPTPIPGVDAMTSDHDAAMEALARLAT